MSQIRTAALASLLAWCCTGPALAADLSVAVSGVRDGEGDVRVVLYERPESFRHEDQAREIRSIAADATTAPVVFTDLAPGRYAVIAYHDANRNGKLDLFLGMFPAEGWGMSNDPAVMGPPKFDPAAVMVPHEGGAITIALHY
ncbi:MAG: DUF2141 domain-containing protein [Magnetospirillum sp.]|nr:DUF2141 domain-containing protein [Magnetospirillum sp.]